MAWVEPVVDRTQADIVNRTAKAFLNIADWQRIDGNTSEAQAVILAELGVNVMLEDLTPPTITDFPSADEINTLIENIERLREGAMLPVGTGIAALKHDYQPGPAAPAPNYEAVNAWEKNLKLLYELAPNAAGYLVYCGVAATGQPRYWQHRWRG